MIVGIAILIAGAALAVYFEWKHEQRKDDRRRAELALRSRVAVPRPWLSGLVDVAEPCVLVSPRGTELHLNDEWAADDVLVTLAEIEALG